MLIDIKEKRKINEFLEAVQSESGTAVFGLGLSEKVFLAANVNSPVCFVCNSAEECTGINQMALSLGKKTAIIDSAATEMTLSNIVFGQDSFDKLNTLYLLTRKEIDFLIITPEVLCTKFCHKEDLAANVLKLKTGEAIERGEIINNLVKIGYRFAESVSLAGDFSYRGEVLDVFAINECLPIRLSFFDDTIEEIRFFSIETGLSVKSRDAVAILPNTNVFIGEQSKQVSEKLEKEFICGAFAPQALKTLGEKINLAKNLIENQNPGFNFNFFLPLLNFSSLLDYLTADTVFLFNEPKQILSKLEEFLSTAGDAVGEYVKRGELSPLHRNAFYSLDEVKQSLRPYNKAGFQVLTAANNLFTVTKTLLFKTLPLIKYAQNSLLARDCRNYLSQNFFMLICAGDNLSANTFADFLKKEGLPINLISNSTQSKQNTINISPEKLPCGFSFAEDKIVVLGDSELKSHLNRRVAAGRKGPALTEIPLSGDFVVHAVHGIGMCRGITKLSNKDGLRDYLVLEYKNGDKLYVPTEQMDSLSKFTGSDRKPALNVIGGQEFERIKQKVKESAKGMALELLSLYSKREAAHGEIFYLDSELMNSFADAFNFTETADQAAAIDDCIRDMTRGRVMDRLICGDVGFGKTEVALRALMLCVLNGRQGVFLAPTTILSEQHYNTCKVRFASFGINVACLNRFRSAKEQRQILKDLKDGKINIICGTHRLLSSDVVFSGLGLLILDEEQRFGVADKEKIKSLKSNINVLTLSATPIPRTLHMSLTGIRDISLIETPPVDRLPVQSIVTEYSPVLLGEAVKREFSRAGQVLILYNRVETITDFASSVRKLLPDNIKIGVAHGQMPKNNLEQVILDVYSGKTHVLIATTLIENGIDLPRANTLFVIDADRLGLAELYQLRGRVGRSNVLAYAYFTYRGQKVLTDEAYKRLAAILEFTELGSGYKIALRDLEIRGAGNLLGKEQSGAMTRVGYDMYVKLLNSALSELKGEVNETLRETVIDMDIDAYIDTNFIKSESARMHAYALISSVKDVQEADTVKDKLTDMYGKLPAPILGLIEVALFKALCQKLGIRRLIVKEEKTAVYFYEGENKYGEAILKTISKNKSARVLNKGASLTINFDFNAKTNEAKREILLEFLKNCLQ